MCRDRTLVNLRAAEWRLSFSSFRQHWRADVSLSQDVDSCGMDSVCLQAWQVARPVLEGHFLGDRALWFYCPSQLLQPMSPAQSGWMRWELNDADKNNVLCSEMRGWMPGPKAELAGDSSVQLIQTQRYLLEIDLSSNGFICKFWLTTTTVCSSHHHVKQHVGLSVVLGLSHRMFVAECVLSHWEHCLMDEQIVAQSSILLHTSRETLQIKYVLFAYTKKTK